MIKISNRAYTVNTDSKGLDKETFWNGVAKDSPKIFKVFKEWIDDYKYRNGVSQLCKGIGGSWEQLKFREKQFKFHDWPYGMQFGVLRDFLNQQGYLFWGVPSYNEDGSILWYWQVEILHRPTDAERGLLTDMHLDLSNCYKTRYECERACIKVLFKAMEVR